MLRRPHELKQVASDLSPDSEEFPERSQVLALKAAKMGTFDWDFRRDFLVWDHGHEKLWGYAKGEFDGSFDCFAKRIHPEDLERVVSEIEESRATGGSFESEFRVVRSDGVFWIVSSGSFQCDEKGDAIRMRGVVVESTARNRSEKRLVESREYLESLVSSVNGIVWELDVASFEFTFVSSQAERILGYPVERWLGDCSFWLDHVHPEDRGWAGAFCSEKTGKLENHEFNYRMIAADGSIVWINDIVTVVSENGEAKTLRGIMVDITERVESENAAKRSHQRFRALIEHNSDCIQMIDADFTVFYASPSVFSTEGAAENDILGGDIYEGCHPDDLETVTRKLARSVTFPEEPVFLSWRRKHEDGHWIHLEGKATNLLDDPAVKAIVLNYRNVSSRHELEEELRQAQKMEAIGRLAGGVAHDFNNILTIINGYGSMLMTDVKGVPEIVDASREIVNAAERAAALTRQLLAFSRRQVMQTRVLDINASTKNLHKMLLRVLGEDVETKLILDDSALMTKADAGMIDQILLNLVVNARDAMPEGGRITIESGRKSISESEAKGSFEGTSCDFVFLRVTDTGTGIPEENLSQIFDPFFTTKEQGKGTGLGLATVFGIVQQHGGRVLVDSQEGVGTSFQILFPESHQTVGFTEGSTVNCQVEGGSETILLVEDEEPVRVLIRILLERAGYRVIEATNGLEAIETCEEKGAEIELLLTDIVMPGGMSGLDLAERLQMDFPDLKVVFTSGYSPDIAGRELDLQEGQNFVPKPASRNQVLSTIRQSLDVESPEFDFEALLAR